MSTGGQPTRLTYSMVFGKSIRSGWVMDCRYVGDVGRSKPPGSATVDALQCAESRIWATGGTGGGNCSHQSTRSVDSSTLSTRKLCSLYSVYLHPNISKLYFDHWEPLGVSQSCRTRIAGWSNPRVYRTNAVALKCTWKQLGAPTTSLGAPGSAGDKRAITDNKSESTWQRQRQAWERRLQAWEHVGSR
jgi:hypothetical protein